MTWTLSRLAELGHIAEHKVRGIGHWERHSHGFMRPDGVRVMLRYQRLPNEHREVPSQWRIWGNGIDEHLPHEGHEAFDVLRWVEQRWPWDARG